MGIKSIEVIPDFLKREVAFACDVVALVAERFPELSNDERAKIIQKYFGGSSNGS